MTARRFDPAPPAGPVSPHGEVGLKTPEEIGEEIEARGWQKYMLPVMVTVMVLMVGVMIFNIASSGGRGGFSMQGLMWPFMIMMMAGGYMGMRAGAGSKSIPEIDADRKVYLRYLSGVRERVTASAAQQVKYWGFHGPHPLDLTGLVGGSRMWSRRSGDKGDLFLSVRVGVGDAPAQDKLTERSDKPPTTPGQDAQLVGPDAAPKPYLEPVQNMWLIKFLRTHNVVRDCPKLITPRLYPTVSIGGDPDQAAGLLRAMICQLALFHSPETLQLRVRTTDPDNPDWEWLKWLPHLHHPTEQGVNGALRLIFDGEDCVADFVGRGPHQPDQPPTGPYCVVINLDPDATFLADGKAGVTYITLGTGVRAQYQLKVAADGVLHHVKRGPDQQWQLLGVADDMTPTDADTFARRLAGWSITGTQLPETKKPPAKVDMSWLGLVGAKTIEELTPARWREYPHQDRNRLRFPFGHNPETGEPIALDIKQGAERGMGPHGIMIGTTGSGKSQLLRTVLLSAMATHSPRQLQLILANFKGGLDYSGMETMPHVQAVITEMEDSADLVDRFQQVMRGIIYQRKQIFIDAQKQTGQAIGDFTIYEQKRQAGLPLAPLPSLWVVVDEFAEMMNKHEKFIDEFVSIAQTGRGLGIHLLLATQALANVSRFWEKIKGNLSYGIGLRTESTQESKLVLGDHQPVAFHINNEHVGEGYLRVGSGDPIKFQAVYTGAEYRPPTQNIDADAEPVSVVPASPSVSMIVPFTASSSRGKTCV